MYYVQSPRIPSAGNPAALCACTGLNNLWRCRARMNLARALAREGVKHSEVAARAGQERSYVTRQVRGDRPLTPEVARAATKLLDESRALRLAETARDVAAAGEFDAAEIVLGVAERIITDVRGEHS